MSTQRLSNETISFVFFSQSTRFTWECKYEKRNNDDDNRNNKNVNSHWETNKFIYFLSLEMAAMQWKWGDFFFDEWIDYRVEKKENDKILQGTANSGINHWRKKKNPTWKWVLSNVTRWIQPKHPQTYTHTHMSVVLTSNSKG